MSVTFKDNSMHVKSAINEATIAWLYEASGELEAQVKRNTKGGDSGLKDSWRYTVDESKGEAIVGNPLELAIWYELGTGIYAVHGDGRKDVPWAYQDDEGKWHMTKGMRPHRPLQSSYSNLKKAIIARFEDILKGMK